MSSFILSSEEVIATDASVFMHAFVENVAYLAINIMELISISIILITTIVAFYKLVKHQPFARVYLLHGQSIGLTFKLGAEIIRTVPARTMDEIWQIFLLIIIKIMMGLLVEWELKGVEDPYSSDGFEHHAGQPSILHFHSRASKQMKANAKKSAVAKEENPSPVVSEQS